MVEGTFLAAPESTNKVYISIYYILHYVVAYL